jgi:hypothetical protein
MNQWDQPITEKPCERAKRDQALKLLAESVYAQLRTKGYLPREIVAFSTELLGLLTSDIGSNQPK